MNHDDYIKAGGAIAVALSGLIMAYQRYGVLRSKDRTITAVEATTASAGLPSCSLWSNANVVTIVP